MDVKVPSDYGAELLRRLVFLVSDLAEVILELGNPRGQCLDICVTTVVSPFSILGE